MRDALGPFSLSDPEPIPEPTPTCPEMEIKKAIKGESMTISSGSESDTPNEAKERCIFRIGPIDLTMQHIERVSDPLAWFDNDLVDAYFYILTKERSKMALYKGLQEQQVLDFERPLVYAFSSFFYTKFKALHYVPKAMLEAWYSPTSWTRKHSNLIAQLKERQGLLLFPIIEASHWVLVVAHLAPCRLVYYDSLGSGCRGRKILSRLEQFMIAFLQAIAVPCASSTSTAVVEDSLLVAMTQLSLTGASEAAQRWQCSIPSHLPRQLDGNSCGPFICYYARMVCQGQSESDMTFSADSVTAFRCSEMFHLFQHWQEATLSSSTP